jgi:ABC-type branched-subunit amino acid transport system ATPase component
MLHFSLRPIERFCQAEAGYFLMSKRYVTGPITPLNRPTVVHVEQLCVRYAQQLILHNVSFEVYDAQVVAILCKNRLQKALLLASLQGVMYAHEGTITLLGTRIPPMPPELQRQIGVVVPTLQRQRQTVHEYVRVATKFTISSIDEQLDTYIAHYSLCPTACLGHLTVLQFRLLTLAVALLPDPSLVIFDDPLQNLAPVERATLEQNIAKLRREGRTLLILGTYPLATEYLSLYDAIIYVE